MRDEVRAVKELAGTNGVYQFPEGSSYGVDERSVILVQVKDGDWKLISKLTKKISSGRAAGPAG